MVIRETKRDRVFNFINVTVLSIVFLLCLYPLWFIIIASISNPDLLNAGKVWLIPREISFDGYKALFADDSVMRGYFNTILYTVGGTCVNLAVTLPAAYALSRPDFVGRQFFTKMFLFTMFFSGGLIPTYLLINNLGLLDSMWAVILPGAFSVWNMIIARTYYQGVPRELREASDVDGASEMTFFFKILVPICMPLVAVLALWQFVAMWNSYFDAMIYLNDTTKQPLQLVLRSILIQSQPESGMIADIQSTAERAQLAELLKYATIIISSLPLIVMYPFFQKYFDAGIMAGSIKG